MSTKLDLLADDPSEEALQKMDKEERAIQVSNKEKRAAAQSRALRALYINFFQAVVQHVMVIQSEQALFLKAHNNDTLWTSKTLSATTSLVGILGLVLNQIGGKMSDAYGRRPFFMLGPVINFIVGLLVFRMPGNRFLLASTRILKMLATTFSGSVMGGAALGEIVRGQAMAIVGTRISSIVGIAVVVGPFLESAIMRLTRGSVRSAYLGVSAVAVLQFVSTWIQLPETLRNPTDFNLSATLAALNPLDSLTIFRGKNKTLKQLVGIWMFQMIMEGKNLSDLSQVWMREHIKWSFEAIRNFVSLWGGCATLSGLYMAPYVLRRTTVRGFTTLANVSMAIGYTPALFSERGIAFVVSLPFQLLGVNGGTALAIGPVMRRLADEEGYGGGEFSAWTNNLRAVPSVLTPLLIGQLYTFLKKRNIYAGVVYPTTGFFGAVVPALLMWGLVDNKQLK